MKLIELPHFSHVVFDPRTITRIAVKVDVKKYVPELNGRFLRPEGQSWYVMIDQDRTQSLSDTEFESRDEADAALAEITTLVNSYR